MHDTLVGRIVDTTAEIYLTSSSNVRIFEADVLRGQVWEQGTNGSPMSAVRCDRSKSVSALRRRLARRAAPTVCFRNEHIVRKVMQVGTVKIYNSERGFGFIQPNDGGNDVFIHATAPERSGAHMLSEGRK